MVIFSENLFLVTMIAMHDKKENYKAFVLAYKLTQLYIHLNKL